MALGTEELLREHVVGARPAAPAGRRPRRDSALRRLLAAADAFAILSALGFALIVFGEELSAGRLLLAAATLPAWIVLFKAYGLYDRDSARVSHSTVDDIPWLFHALLVGTVGLSLASRAAPVADLSLREAFAFGGVAMVAVFAARAAARAAAMTSIPRERVLFLGSGTMAALLVDKMRSHPEYALDPVGFVDAHATASLRDRGLPYLGTPDDLERLCTELLIDRVVVVAPSVDDGVLLDLIRRTHGLDLRISVLPQVADVLGSSAVIDDVEGVTVIGVNPPTMTRSSRFLKRVMDVTVASTMLVLALPFMLAIAVAVKTTSRGPILFAQRRVGRGGRQFRMLKFRTMVADADAQVVELQRRSTHPAWLKLDHDPRVTRVGRFLRHTSLDELPQLWNVLRGEMSLVGPRPMPLYVDERIAGWGRRRLDLTPGLTGLWQVLGRANIPFEEMVKLDYLYVTNWSLWEDIRLLVRTLPAVLRRRGVN